jgi:hypothetical protein
MAAATRPVPGDFVPPRATLLEHFVAVHAVDGLLPRPTGEREGEFLLLRAGAERNCTRSFCLGQDLCGDAAATVFHCVQLEPILQAPGARGYRAAQLEGGVAAERLQLVAFALGFGATGLTFLDDVHHPPVEAFRLLQAGRVAGALERRHLLAGAWSTRRSAPPAPHRTSCRGR